jgi:AcrR family transcriptional regulator
VALTSTHSRVPRWQRRAAQRPEEITDAALKVFAQRGLHNTTLDDVAKEAGISKGTIYLYFKNKEELFVATAQRVVPVPDEQTIKKLLSENGDVSLSHLLREVARKIYRRFCSPAYLAFFSMMAAEILRHPEWGQLFFRRIVLELNRRVAEVLEQAMATGTCRQLDATLAARAFIGMFLIMAMSQEHLGGKHYTPFAEKKIIDTLTDIFLQGIVPTEDSSS